MSKKPPSGKYLAKLRNIATTRDDLILAQKAEDSAGPAPQPPALPAAE